MKIAEREGGKKHERNSGETKSFYQQWVQQEEACTAQKRHGRCRKWDSLWRGNALRSVQEEEMVEEKRGETSNQPPKTVKGQVPQRRTCRSLTTRPAQGFVKWGRKAGKINMGIISPR